MAATSNGFLDNLVNGILGPKGTMADWQHASRLYVDGNLKLAPKSKFLYHTYFQLDPVVRSILPELKDKHNLEIGMLVKSADLPRYTSNVETRNKYNRKKNVQTRIDYDECRFVFHDDNSSTTSSLMKEYYNFYYRDGKNDVLDFGTRNKFALPNKKFGLDNGMKDTFFSHIKIYQAHT